MTNTKSLVSFDELPDVAHVRLLTVQKLFACSPSTVWRWVQRGLIPKPHKISTITVWNVGELRKTLNAMGEQSRG
ncbi:MAG: helix-turn-helix domain-containing protein [Blastochloris viridis]|uniref:Helix-turn-helix domain-containing protein n=1 Tax=Blastochloris viridis TaxID=1079 RepID=A0A6N4RDF6_BLAVI|nr:MAG: helix-turn-helix domain-containing protein [Blastochloris viridis]